MKFALKVSIITVVYNRINDLRVTIESVINQRFKNYEYLIIDGASTDGTLELVKSYGDKIHQVYSEKDGGIYEAMNKGLQKAQGEYIIFMNAGDSFYSADVLATIFENEESKADFIFGDTMFVNEKDEEIGLMSEIRKRKLHADMHWQEMKYGMMFCHQSFLVKRSIAPLYDLQYRYSADIDWIIQCMKKSTSNYYYEQSPIANFQLGGASLQNQKQSLYERFAIIKKHFGAWQSMLAHLKIALKLR